ncbi:MAG: hypothetical protein E7C30_02190 [Streptococcus salivarius]|nr:hypothetical protein [Streptococcus salivarius]
MNKTLSLKSFEKKSIGLLGVMLLDWLVRWTLRLQNYIMIALFIGLFLDRGVGFDPSDFEKFLIGIILLYFPITWAFKASQRSEDKMNTFLFTAMIYILGLLAMSMVAAYSIEHVTNPNPQFISNVIFGLILSIFIRKVGDVIRVKTYRRYLFKHVLNEPYFYPFQSDNKILYKDFYEDMTVDNPETRMTLVNVGAVRKAYQNCVTVFSVKVEKQTYSKYFVNVDNNQLTRDYEDKESPYHLDIVLHPFGTKGVPVYLKLISFTIIRPTGIAREVK